MKIFSCLLLFSIISVEVHAQCKRCEDLRRYHEAHPEENYEHYEDYLKDQDAKKNTTQKPTEASK